MIKKFRSYLQIAFFTQYFKDIFLKSKVILLTLWIGTMHLLQAKCDKIYETDNLDLPTKEHMHDSL